MCAAYARTVALLLLALAGGCSLNRTPLVPGMDVGAPDVGNIDAPIGLDSQVDDAPDLDGGFDGGGDVPIDVGVEDTGVDDTGVDAPTLLQDCNTTFRTAAYYSLCEEGPTTCEFLTRRTTAVDIACADVCLRFGSTCAGAFIPTPGSTCPRASDDIGCTTTGRTHICRCLRVP
jgi:hypothetical protein